MTDSHLLNAIRLLRRNAEQLQAAEVSAGYSFLSGLQGEMAQYYAERDLDNLEEMHPDDFLEEICPLSVKLMAEADRRKLKYD